MPTLYSSFALFVCAALLAQIGLLHKKNGSASTPWLGLAAIFIYLTIDETASIHEKLSIFLQAGFHTSGIFYYAWVIPYGLALIVLGIIYLRFISALPAQIRNLYLLSAGIYVAGAIGLEITSTYIRHLIYIPGLLYTIEDLLEMLGVALFIYTLLTYIELTFGSIQITLGEKSDA